MQGSSDSSHPDGGSSSSGDVRALGSPGTALPSAVLRKGAGKELLPCGLSSRGRAAETPVSAEPSSGERALPADRGQALRSPGWRRRAAGARSHAAPALRAPVASTPLFNSESLH